MLAVSLDVPADGRRPCSLNLGLRDSGSVQQGFAVPAGADCRPRCSGTRPPAQPPTAAPWKCRGGSSRFQQVPALLAAS